MLARRRPLKFGEIEIERTPLLVPSFSSKGFPDVAKILKTAEEIIEGPMLVSAYDIYYGEISPPFDFAPVVFLDSGGYEASKDSELSDLRERDHHPRDWKQEFHREIVESWSTQSPTVFISYDHPKERLHTREQIERALALPLPKNSLREILLKPEKEGQTLLRIASILENVRLLAGFDIIGVTEKEIGNSILGRMANVARLRLALDRVGLDSPIHVFGSLDTVTSLCYFVAGADIFDGLTWLRFAFNDGHTLYRQNYGAVTLGLDVKAHLLEARCWHSNYYYLKDMQLEMRRFLNGGEFSVFRYHADLIAKAYQSLAEEVGLNGR